MALHTPAHERRALYVALELSDSSWLIAGQWPGLEKPKLHRIEAGDTAALLALIASLRARVAAKLGPEGWMWPAASRRDVTASGCTGCWWPMASPATCWSRAA